MAALPQRPPRVERALKLRRSFTNHLVTVLAVGSTVTR
jgi:hypothetical protein